MNTRYGLLLESLGSAKFFLGKKSKEENKRIERQLILLPPCNLDELFAVNSNYQEEKQELILHVSLVVGYILVIIACAVVAKPLPTESILKFILVFGSSFLAAQTTKTLGLIIISKKMMSIMHHFLLIHDFNKSSDS